MLLNQVGGDFLRQLAAFDNSVLPNAAHAQSVDYLRVGTSMFCHVILITEIPCIHHVSHNLRGP